MLPFVSVLTPTYNRRKFLPAAITCFKAQTYPANRMEWIVIDDGDDKVGDIFAASGLKNVRYISLEEHISVGAKRNMLIREAKGEICVNWDDDDYYPPDRVRDAVTRLRSSPGRRCPVVGSSELYLYYVDREEFWIMKAKGPTHCTEGTMAFWREYGIAHKYNEEKRFAEGPDFLDGFTTPILHLTSLDTMLVICHDKNTFDKHRILMSGKNPAMIKFNGKLQKIVKDKKLVEFYKSLKNDYVAPGNVDVPYTKEELSDQNVFTHETNNV
jgi:glycosyltransferase involved in cell wall biosynthesis